MGVLTGTLANKAALENKSLALSFLTHLLRQDGFGALHATVKAQGRDTIMARNSRAEED